MKLNNKIASIILCFITLGLTFNSCTFQTGQQLYESGLKLFSSANHECYQDEKGLNEAINCFEKAIGKGFKEREVFYNLAWCYSLKDDTKNAERIYSDGLQYFPNDIEFYFRRGECRKKMREHQKAYNDFNQVILLDTMRKYEYISNAFYARGAMDFLLGNKMDAEEDRETAQHLSGDSLRTYADYCQLWK